MLAIHVTKYPRIPIVYQIFKQSLHKIPLKRDTGLSVNVI